MPFLDNTALAAAESAAASAVLVAAAADYVADQIEGIPSSVAAAAVAPLAQAAAARDEAQAAAAVATQLATSDAQTAANVTNGTQTKAALSATIATTELPLRRRDLPTETAWKPLVSTDVPTRATAGPGGASGVSSAVAVPFNTDKVTRLGCLPVAVNLLGTDYQQNQVSGSSGSGATPWAIEFDHYGRDLAVKFRNAVGNGSIFWVWVDGRPVTATPQASTANAANSLFWYRLTFATTAHRRIRIYMAGADFGGLSIGPSDTVSATKRPAKSLAIVGDSWANGTGATTQLGAFSATLGLMLGVEVYHCSYGGTGYTAVGGFATYGSATRVNPLGVIQPDYVLVEGSSNDNGATASAVGTAAAACYAAIQAACPDAELWVCAVQATGTPAAQAVANTAAVESAALAAGATVVASPIGESWITGTGGLTGVQTQPGTLTVGAPYGSGSTLPAGTYYAVVTAVTSAGETIASNQVSVTATAGQSYNLNWSAPPAGPATASYNVYIGVASGVYGLKFNTASTNVAINNYNTNAGGTPPTSGPDTGAKGDGNADVFNNAASPGHPTQAGHDYFARRLFSDIAAELVA